MFGLPTFALYGGIGLLLLYGLTIGVFEYRIVSFQAELATARQEAAEARRDAEHINALVANAEAAREAQRAKDALKAEGEARDQAKLIGDLRDARDAAERRRRIATEAIKKEIANAKAGELSPVLRIVVDRVREQQQAPNNDGPAASGGGAGQRLSADAGPVLLRGARDR